MRYLKQFESTNNSEIIDYIKSCFIDFIDDEKVNIETLDSSIELEFKEPSNNHQNSDDMSFYFDLHKKIENFYEDLDVCIEKFKINYNNKMLITRYLDYDYDCVVMVIKIYL